MQQSTTGLLVFWKKKNLTITNIEEVLLVYGLLQTKQSDVYHANLSPL